MLRDSRDDEATKTSGEARENSATKERTVHSWFYSCFDADCISIPRRIKELLHLLTGRQLSEETKETLRQRRWTGGGRQES